MCRNPRSGNYAGGEPERLTALKFAAMLGAAYVDVELKAAAYYFAGAPALPPAPLPNIAPPRAAVQALSMSLLL